MLPTSCSGSWTLQREIVSGTKKYDHGLTHLLHSELHWLDVADRVTYKLGVIVYKCLHSQAPDYLWAVHSGRSSCWTTASSFPPSTRCSTVSARYVGLYGRRTFAVDGSALGTLSALEAFFATMRYINWHLHYITSDVIRYKVYRWRSHYY